MWHTISVLSLKDEITDYPDFSALFVVFLRERFGFGEDNDSVDAAQVVSEDVGTLTRQLSGIVSLPGGISDKDLFASAMLEKYNSLA